MNVQNKIEIAKGSCVFHYYPEALNNFSLSSLDSEIFFLIHSISENGNDCILTNLVIGELFSCDENRIAKSITKLLKKELILKVSTNDKIRNLKSNVFLIDDTAINEDEYFDGEDVISY